MIGAVVGALWVIAIGLVLIYKSSRVFNFASEAISPATPSA